MLIQEKLIERVKQKCMEDASISASMMYGSFTKGEGDSYSDIEFYVFVDDHAFSAFHSRDWISEVDSIDLIFYNEYGTEVVIFSTLIRGEFHFLPVSKIDIIKSFKPTGVFPDPKSMYICDSTGQLLPLLVELGGAGPNRMTSANVNEAFNHFVNAWLLGVNVLKRGEFARSLETLTHVQKHLLHLMRVKEKTVERWLNSTKNLEWDLTTESYQDYVLMTSSLNKQELQTAYTNSIEIATRLHQSLRAIYNVEIDQTLLSKLNGYV